LIGPESTRLPEQLVDKRRLSMVNMGDNCNVTYTVHRSRWRIAKMAAPNRIFNEVYVQNISYTSVTNESFAQIATKGF
jgi:hypothetical protein